MEDPIDETFMRVVSEAADSCGLSTDEFMEILVLGDRKHPDAPEDDCGSISPRDPTEATWCRAAPGHRGSHRPWKSFEEKGGVV